MRYTISRLTELHFGEEYFSTLNDPIYMRFSQHKNALATVETQREYLRSFDFAENFLLAVMNSRGGELVATATLRVHPENRLINLGFLVLKKFSGRGVGKEVLQVLSAWVFELFPLATQQIGTRSENIAMQRISIGAGFLRDNSGGDCDFVYFLKHPPPLTQLLEEKSQDFHIVCNDFGGSLQLSALAKALKIRATASLSGPGIGVFAKHDNAIPNIELTSDAISNKTILLGSGFYGGPESKVLEDKSLLSIRKLVLLDHWVNYKYRFNPNFEHLPDCFLVTNSEAEKIARETFPRTDVIRIPDFLLAEQKRDYLSREISSSNLLFILEPDALLGECSKYRIGNIENYLPGLLNFAKVRGLEQVVLREHPSQSIESHVDLSKFSEEVGISFSTNENLVQDLSCAGVVVGFHSSALYASSMLGVETYSFFAASENHWTTRFPLILEML